MGHRGVKRLSDYVPAEECARLMRMSKTDLLEVAYSFAYHLAFAEEPTPRQAADRVEQEWKTIALGMGRRVRAL